MGCSAGTEHVCRECDDVFTLSSYRKQKPKFCSLDCANTFQVRGYEARRVYPDCDQCGETFERRPSEVEGKEDLFCSPTCQRAFYREKKSDSVSCHRCGTEFVRARSKLEGRDYYFCTIGCMEKYSPLDVDTKSLVSLYDSGATLVEVGEEFDVSATTVSKYLEEEGVERRCRGPQADVKTDTGLLVRSSYEREVVEYLHEQDVEFEYEPRWFPGLYTPDFILGNETIVEVWGLMGWDEYAEKRTRKEQWYAENDYDLISIEPDDLSNLDAIFADYGDEPMPTVHSGLAW